jgi:hypothetical protein
MTASVAAPWEPDLRERYEKLTATIEQALLACELHDRDGAMLLAAEAVRQCGVLDRKLGHVGPDLGGHPTPLRFDLPPGSSPRRAGSGTPRPASSGPPRIRPEPPRRRSAPVPASDRWWDR